MTLIAQLNEINIHTKEEATGTYQVDCPMPHCQAARKGKKNPTPLKLQIIGESYAHWKCGHCLHTGHIGEKPPEIPLAEVKPPEGEEAPDKVKNLPQSAKSFLHSRGITDEAIVMNGLIWDVERKAIRIPYIHDDEVVNQMLVTVPEGKTRLATSRYIGFYGLSKTVVGQDVVIAQNELDCLALRAAGIANVIGLPNGGHLPEREEGELDYFHTAAELIAKAPRVILAMANDQGGEKARATVAHRIGAAKCWNVHWMDVTLADTFKARGMDCICEDIQLAQPYPVTGLYQVADFEQSLQKYFEGGMASGVSTGWGNVDKYYTVMPCEMTVVTGIPNSGKSEWLDALAVNLALAEGWKFGIFSPENGKEQHVTKLVEKRVEMSADPRHDDRMSIETFFSGAAWVAEHFYFIVGDDEKELPTLDWIMEKATLAILRYGIKGLIIDPWNEIEHLRANGISETEYISQSLSRLKRFARNHAIHLWIVAHPAKMSKGKDGKFMEISLYDISGSAHWANKTDNGIVIHREDEKTTTTDVLVKKVRFKHVGRKGVAYLKYNRSTGRYSRPEYDDQQPLFSQASEDEIQSYEA